MRSSELTNGRARPARRASFTGGVRSSQREESAIQRKDRREAAKDGNIVVDKREELPCGRYRSGQREETTATRGIGVLELFILLVAKRPFLSMFLVSESHFEYAVGNTLRLRLG